MIPNINEFTQQLRMLPDQALQRVAMMYKQDPYILPMVIAEDAARKKMRMAARAQMAQPQPKVVDQAVASLGYTPEEVGIGALPAQNMQGLADGGIAGYADGGNVVMAPGSTPSYQRTAMSPGMLDFAQRSEPVVRMAEGGAVQRFQSQGFVRQGVPDPMLADTPIYLQRTPETEEDYLRRKREAELATMTPVERLLRSREDISTGARFLRNLMYPEAKTITPEQPAKPAKPAAPAAEVKKEEKQEERKEPPRAEMRKEPPSAATKPSTATSESGLYSLTGRLFEPVEDATLRRLRYAKIAAQQRGEEERAEFEAGKPKEKRFAGLEGLLKKQEEGEAAEKENAKALAIFNAGLAMMAGGSPYALQNIAKGAMVGTGEYAGALKEFKQAAKERMKMQADIEDARRAEERDDRKTALILMQRANDRQDKLDEHIADAGMKLGLSRAEVTARLYGTQMETESRERTARASDPLTVIRALSVPGPLREGYTFMQQAKTEPMTRQKLFLEYMKNPLADPNKFGEYVQQYERQFGPLGSVSGAASQSADEALVQQWLKPPR
jgi:hypothetical protein